MSHELKVVLRRVTQHASDTILSLRTFPAEQRNQLSSVALAADITSD